MVNTAKENLWLVVPAQNQIWEKKVLFKVMLVTWFNNFRRKSIPLFQHYFSYLKWPGDGRKIRNKCKKRHLNRQLKQPLLHPCQKMIRKEERLLYNHLSDYLRLSFPNTVFKRTCWVLPIPSINWASSREVGTVSGRTEHCLGVGKERFGCYKDVQIRLWKGLVFMGRLWINFQHCWPPKPLCTSLIIVYTDENFQNIWCLPQDL